MAGADTCTWWHSEDAQTHNCRRRITRGGNETLNEGALSCISHLQPVETERSHLWCMIVCAISWDYEQEMQMSCCWQHHGSSASMCVAYWMIMTKQAVSPVSKPAEQWLQIGRYVLSITRDCDSNANQSCCPLKYICNRKARRNKMEYPS